MKVIMYSPWPNESFGGLAKQYVAAAQNRDHKPGKNKTYFFRTAVQGSLKDLVPEDRLYIMGHGVDSLKAISADADVAWSETFRGSGYSSYRGKLYTWVVLKPDELIAKLREAALPTTFVDFRLWVCKGGDREFSDFGWDFTSKLRETWKSATVVAYTGYLTLGPQTGRKWGAKVKTDESTAAKNFRMVITDDKFFKEFYST